MRGIHWLDATLVCAGPSAPSWRAAALGWWAWLAVQSGQTEHVEERAHEAAELSASVDDHATLALAISVQAVLEMIRGNTDRAAEQYAHAGSAYERFGGLWGDAMARAA